MKIIIACDSYKGCMSSKEVAEHMKRAIRRVDPSIEVLAYTMADGGEGTSAAFCDVCGGEMVSCATTDAYGRRIRARYALIDEGRTAVIEAAAAIGLTMVPREKRNPMTASSYGVGTMLLDAQKRCCQRVIIGLGGSGTNDGGMGLLQSLGVRFYDASHKYLSPQAVNLEKVRYIDFNRLNRLEGLELIVACDVKNHLLGEKGATYTFGRQKGLYPNQLERLDRAMHNYRDQIRRYRKVDLDSFEGGGAAGGIGAVLIGLLGAQMYPGIELLLSYSSLAREAADCDLLITGEGQSDAQTMFGKVPAGIAQIAKTADKPIICISGALGLGYEQLYDLGFIGIFSIADRAMTFPQALQLAPEKLEAATYSILRMFHHLSRDEKRGHSILHPAAGGL